LTRLSYVEISSNSFLLYRLNMIAHSKPSVSATSVEKDKSFLIFNLVIYLFLHLLHHLIFEDKK
jgi:hypothetical protein